MAILSGAGVRGTAGAQTPVPYFHAAYSSVDSTFLLVIDSPLFSCTIQTS